MSVYIVSAARTPIGILNGSFSSLSAADLGSVVLKEVLVRGNVSPDDVNEIILGQALTACAGQNPGRQAAWKAGVPKHVPAYVLNMLCGSGLKSVALGYQSIRCGDNSIVICGGQESMTNAPHATHLRGGIKFGDATLVDTLQRDGLTDGMYNILMGETAENIAKQYNISREEQDKFAAHSQNLAEVAQKNGYFKEEIIPVIVRGRKGDVTVDTDEYPKHGTTVDSLAKLRPCFIKNGGTVTAGNASGINDSAAAVLLMSEAEVQKRSIKPLAKIIAFAQSGIEPEIMGMGPVSAVNEVMKKTGWTNDEVDLFELNEAFGVVAVAVSQQLGISQDKINIHGGAIALGHPLGASGTRILVTLIYALRRIGGKRGVAALCIGGGMGIALAIELV
ncbi:acetyl-CoA acetyltransferase [Bradysia coprophila]|uniref:acetyl-CoA acetyltransferase n=1 Tax=Bradysia coprophila TaxID=38358 RepID=UPI00187DAAAC|nr:acetyl-CoA acetyltransferase [Bradysia coprophila]